MSSGNLQNLNLDHVYSSSESNIVKDFYIPCLENSVSYKRISGYFSSTSLAVAAKGMAHFFNRKGKYELICGIEISAHDYAAISHGDTSRLDDYIRVTYDESDFKTKYISVLSELLALNMLEIKFAVTRNGQGIFHEKLGIFEDASGNKVSFGGSINETSMGWSANTEDFNVFKSWDKSQAAYLERHTKRFGDYWDNKIQSVKVVSAPAAFKEQLLTLRPHNSKSLDSILHDIDQFEGGEYIPDFSQAQEPPRKVRNLREYQLEAIDHWRGHGYVSVFEMATGTGKTFTSINALKEFREKNSYLRALIVVPLATLVEQWKEDLKIIVDDLNIITAAGTNPGWKKELRALGTSAALGNKNNYIIITTYATFSSEELTNFLDASENEGIILVADEMHNIVTKTSLKSASHPAYKYKLGLSATPIRLWKQSESQDALKLFGSNSYVYSLKKAIRNKFLVPYKYHISPVFLTEEEYDEYSQLTKQISKLSAIASSNDQAYTMALTKRSKIKKQAENKLFALKGVVDELLDRNVMVNTLVYVDSNAFLRDAQNLLTNCHIKSTKFTGEETVSERIQIIENLTKKKIDAIVAIKCLDEGVDIPSAVNGIFLSNNTDPREYIQRLGRVLRKDDVSNKKEAYIYDFLVMPPQDLQRSDVTGRNLVKNEVIRANFFKELAVNHDEVQESLGQILDQYGYYFEENELKYNQDEEA